MQAYALHSQHQAEKLLREVRMLRLGKSSAADVDRIRAKFQRFERSDGPCTPASCTYLIELSNFWIVLNHPRLSAPLFSGEVGLGPATFLHNLLTRTGFHFYRVIGSFTISHGILRSLSFDAAIETPAGWALVGDASTYLFSSAYTYSRALEIHPEYHVGSPGGCTGCRMIYAVINPYSTQEQLQHAFDFNLSCISRFWTSCTENRDIMPSAAVDREKDVAYDAAHEDLPRTCTAATAYIFARGSDTVLLTAFRPGALRKSEDETFHVRMRRPRVLKEGKRSDIFELPIDVRKDSWFAKPGTDRPSERILFSANTLLVFLDRSYTTPDPGCGIMRPTPENLAAVRLAVDREQDWRHRFGADLPGR